MLKKEEIALIRERLGRDPNKVELAVFDVAWSEHCSYKSSRRFLRHFKDTKNDRILSGVGENAGVVRINDELALSFKIESHNHPSHIDPFNGAATGVGGIVRDILAMGTRPVALLDSLRFGNPENEHTKRIFEGVVAGISSYGNSIGVPTVSGEVIFDEAYVDNTLVNVACLGIGKIEHLKSAVAGKPGNLVILAGAATGRDGIGGASFASETFKDGEDKRSSVQIGDPFMEKLLIEATMELLDLDGLVGMQDLGAGGLSTTLPEMAFKSGVGIEVDLSKVPLREKDMEPWEIIASESQERMIYIVKPGSEKGFINIFEKYGLFYAIIGHVIEDAVFRIKYNGKILTELPVDFVVEGFKEPYLEIKKPDTSSYLSVTIQTEEEPLTESRVQSLVSSFNLSSKKWVYTQYDHMVQINTVIRPGEHDAALLRLKGTNLGIALTVYGNGRICEIDPRNGAINTVCQAAESIVSLGAEPVAITDGLNFGSPENPEVYYSFREVVLGIKDAAMHLSIPVISGNVSFYNESEKRRIYPTPIIGMVGIREGLTEKPEVGFRHEKDTIILLGKEEDDFGGSEYLSVFYGMNAGRVPRCDFELEKRLLLLTARLVRDKVVSYATPVKRGGLLMALIKSAIRGNMGFLSLIDKDEIFWLGEWPGRMLVSTKNVNEVIHMAEDLSIPYKIIGKTGGKEITLKRTVMHIEEAKENYYQTLYRLMDA